MKGPPQEHHSQYMLDERACRMICPIAAAMVGVCLTAIGILRVVIAVRKANTLADDMLALDSVLFLIATLTSYFAIRHGPTKRLHELERIADVTFIAAMSLMTVAALVITYALAV
ncbi:hypothetical protein [Sphingomonas sp. NIBR02145]|uniref:hypothetical protein n=1 Tax=Sphingomonas sp. NIBR02145 TaxID=3014784 RepID=UPI0022B304B6|nr:hypothetical protein [Sphingomonas sp. NIBR02145]WHU04846.1 hypothetical protein O3305_09730 [Sphingomonas sp. NIBR02145]